MLPYQVQSGYGKYSAVAFDLEKLKAFDPKGVAEFRKEWNLPDKKPVKKKEPRDGAMKKYFLRRLVVPP